MSDLEKLTESIVNRVNIGLGKRTTFDAGPYIRNLIPPDRFARFRAVCGVTLQHPIHFRFHHTSLAGSYFLGKCTADRSVLYKSDVRGDELKAKSDTFKYGTLAVPLHDDEFIHIRYSFLIRNLVHNHSHDPENPEEFIIANTASMHYANIHGSPVEGCFLGPFATVDLTRVRNCVIGAYAYVQTGELADQCVPPGEIRIASGDCFRFVYRFPADVLDRYVHLEPGGEPSGAFMDFAGEHEPDFERVFEVVQSGCPIPVPAGAYLSRYAVVKGDTAIGENVFVTQRACLENARLGEGVNVQENCCVINSILDGCDVTAHGAKVIHAHLGEKVFTGFNSFLRGNGRCELRIGTGSIVMPHTIIDLEEPLVISEKQLVWGCIRNRKDLELHSLPLEKLAAAKGGIEMGSMRFEGDGLQFVEAFTQRIEHILQENGAYFDGTGNQGHAQKERDISFNIIQSYPGGSLKGMCPAIDIRS